jgi:RNA polymerase sigma factor (sigma-70 family)
MDSRPLRSLLERLRRTAGTPGDGLSDAELLRRFVGRRDEAAFELLVWRHGPMVLGVCRRVLRNPADAEDAFQATFLALAGKAGGIARGGAVGPWLCRVALRAALRARTTAAKRVTQTLPADLPSPEVGGPAERDWQPILDEEINRLPERYRRPVVLCHLQGCTLAEAARQLGCPRGTVAVRLVRARQRLRVRLTRRGVALAATLSGALVSESAVSAALVKATVRAALGYALRGAAGALSPSVLTITEGVLRAMLLSKIKFVAAVLLATALAGAGAAWVVTYRADAGEPPTAGSGARAAAPQADGPPASRNVPDRRADEERAAADRRREELKRRLERAMELLPDAEAVLAKREEEWLNELIDARLKVMDLRQELTAKERELNALGSMTDPMADDRLRSLVADRDRAAQRLDKARETVDRESNPLVQRMADELKDLGARVDSRRKELEKEAAEVRAHRDEGFARLRPLRRELIVAEEKLLALQRRQERQREEARRELEDRAARVRQLRQALDDAESAPPPAGRPAADVERKLDQVLRELSELRRALRPPEEKRPEEP